MDADFGRHVHVRVGLRHQPGAGATLPDHEGLRYRGQDPVAILADHFVPVGVHVFRGPGHFLQVPGLRPDQVGIPRSSLPVPVPQVRNASKHGKAQFGRAKFRK